MNKKISISIINSALAVAFLLIISLGTTLWVYSYVNKLTKNNIEEYFNQTYNLVNLVIENEQKYLSDTTIEISNLFYRKDLSNKYDEIEKELYNLKSIEQIDLLFLKTSKKVYDYSNSLFDTEEIIQEILNKKLNFENIIISINIDDQSFPMLLSQKKIEDKLTGRIKDILYAGKILNDNFTLVNSIKESAKLEAMYIYFDSKLISTTSTNSIDIKHLNDTRLYKKDDTLYYNKSINIYDNETLNLILVSKNNSFNSVKDFFIKQSISLILFIFILFIIFYLVSKKLIINPFSRLYIFANEVKKDKEATFEPTNIYEFDNFALNLKTIIDELRDVKEQYTSAIDGVQDGLWDIDLESKKIFISNRFKEMLGYEKDDNINSLFFWYRNIHRDDFKKTIYLLKTHMKKESNVFESDYRFKCKDGSFKWIKIRGKVFFDESDKPIRISGFHTDIDEIIKLQEQNKEKERMLYQQSKLAAMGEMIGNIAHQWRQPLTVISINASIVSMELENENINKQECIKDLEKLVETVKYLSSIIEKFMHFFDPNNKSEIFDIKESIEENLELFEVAYKMDDIEIIMDLEDIEIRGNKFELMQVILNLINNAKDSLIKLEKDRCIFMTCFSEDNNLVFSIRDNGGGISEDINDRIYEPYFTTKHKSQGTGLGLYMSNEIITKNFNGLLLNETKEFSFKGKKYKGEEFIIKVPII